MKKLSLSLPFPRILSLLVCAGFVAACHPGPAKTNSDNVQKLMDNGYSPAPVVNEVTQSGPGMLTVKGQALPDGRVRFILGPQRAIGVTADSKGRFSADLPADPKGSVFDLLMEDRGRLMHAEGRLFVPPGQPAKAIIMRPGAASLPVARQPEGIAVLDYDAAGALAVSGRVAPKTAVDVIVNGQLRGAQPISAGDGAYTAMTQMLPAPGDSPTTLNIVIEAGGATWKRDVMVSRPADGGDHVTLIPEGWRVDWKVPGGGVQTTLVF